MFCLSSNHTTHESTSISFFQLVLCPFHWTYRSPFLFLLIHLIFHFPSLNLLLPHFIFFFPRILISFQLVSLPPTRWRYVSSCLLHHCCCCGPVFLLFFTLTQHHLKNYSISNNLHPSISVPRYCWLCLHSCPPLHRQSHPTDYNPVLPSCVLLCQHCSLQHMMSSTCVHTYSTPDITIYSYNFLKYIFTTVISSILKIAPPICPFIILILTTYLPEPPHKFIPSPLKSFSIHHSLPSIYSLPP